MLQRRACNHLCEMDAESLQKACLLDLQSQLHQRLLVLPLGPSTMVGMHGRKPAKPASKFEFKAWSRTHCYGCAFRASSCTALLASVWLIGPKTPLFWLSPRRSIRSSFGLWCPSLLCSVLKNESIAKMLSFLASRAERFAAVSAMILLTLQTSRTFKDVAAEEPCSWLPADIQDVSESASMRWMFRCKISHATSDIPGSQQIPSTACDPDWTCSQPL